MEICLPRTAVINLYTAAEQKDVLQKILNVKQNELDNLKAQIANLQEQLEAANRRIGIDESEINNLKSQIATMVSVRNDLEAIVTSLKKEVRRNKRAIKWTAAGGLLGMVAVFLIK